MLIEAFPKLQFWKNCLIFFKNQP